jgi:hypothetical protein
MTPRGLQPEHFQAYAPQARQLAVQNIELLRRLPVGFVPLLLREVIGYDYKFPVERKELERQFGYLQAMSAEQLQRSMRPFAQLRIAPEVERLDWVNTPADFSEQLSSHLWTTHQIDVFRAAAVEYVGNMNAARAEEPLPTHRLGLAMIGQGANGAGYALFRKLRPHGVYYKAVDGSGGAETILKLLAARAERHPAPFAHWHIDGGIVASPPAGLTCVSYGALTPMRARLQAAIQKGYETSIGSEALRTTLARMRPEDVGLAGTGSAAVLNRFQLSLLTEGSGTQIFSTTFVQWAAREAWRRAQPLTLSTRFTARQREDSSYQMLSEARRNPVLDAEGSLIDADMGAYYTWINQQRLIGAAQARFLVWFEGHGDALVVGPGLAKGTESAARIELEKLVRDLV